MQDMQRKAKPDFAIIDAKPIVFSPMVLPPVLGPVITSTFVFLDTRKSTGTGWRSSISATFNSYTHYGGIIDIRKLQIIWYTKKNTNKNIPLTPTLSFKVARCNSPSPFNNVLFPCSLALLISYRNRSKQTHESKPEFSWRQDKKISETENICFLEERSSCFAAISCSW